MNKKNLRAFFLLFSLVASFCCSSQSLKEKVTTAEFRKLDANASGWLSGNELTACNCKSYDSNGDNEITKDEFFAGQGVKTGTTRQGTGEVKANKESIAKERGTPASSNKLAGAWWHTTIMYADGKDYQLRNRQSGLNLNDNGSYVLNTWLGGANNMRTTGTYSVSGNNLTLKQRDGKIFKYALELSADQKLLTIRADDGSGYKLERSK